MSSGVPISSSKRTHNSIEERNIEFRISVGNYKNRSAVLTDVAVTCKRLELELP
jgi:hypothetical protein